MPFLSSRILSASTPAAFAAKAAFRPRALAVSRNPIHIRRQNFSSSLLRFSEFPPHDVERVEEEVDVCIVGAGPAGLCAAIRLKQLEQEHGGEEKRIVVLEKGAEAGSHILSGAVIETKALDELLPNWKELGAPLNQPASNGAMRFLFPNSSYPIPHPPQMSNKGNYIVSLSQVTAWLAAQAEELGVEIYPGFAGARLLFSEDGKSVRGVGTNDVGLDKSGRMKESYEPGMNFISKVTLLGEGAHGSLSKIAMKKFNLRADCDPQTYGIGLKEVWKVRDEVYEPGKVIHTMGWPLDWKTYGGGWEYHTEGGMVSLGLVIGLDYTNPYLNPYKEFQRMKHHPYYKKLLEGGERLAYGARVLNEGGVQSIPKLFFPGGALIGCSAGFVNVPKIKGTHNAMKSGMLAAEAAYEQLTSTSESADESIPVNLESYETALKNSWIYKELWEVRNVRPSFHNPLGNLGGMIFSGLDTFILKGRGGFTLHNNVEDHVATNKASECKPIDYPAPDGKLSFDILTSVSLTATNHAENQPVHLQLPNEEGAKVRHTETNVRDYAGLLGRACPAAVYEYVDAEPGDADAAEGKKFIINSQNCIHCKTCSIKTPTQDITWTVPEGGGGPKYTMT
ncbi:electron-transferring-flavoprotein dehydrogenase [Phaffia rhodozyma]|uniref:Electron transfer flavoprotein-ubiquinone oxidoreductase n=1 Tax=Phaffia rhodozyma TaxID=264483 RepID=A0A0F7SNN6_PHARH|nr:electron-transferring-flavoprotein dehydrogenase [Phaffia rhodozyma]